MRFDHLALGHNTAQHRDVVCKEDGIVEALPQLGPGNAQRLQIVVRSPIRQLRPEVGRKPGAVNGAQPSAGQHAVFLAAW